MSLTSSQLALALGYSRGRISQLVKEGKLIGAFTGKGRARRFDVSRVASLLNVRLDMGQQLGNGALAAAMRAELLGDAPAPVRSGSTTIEGSGRGDDDGDRYRTARAEQAEIDTILKRRRLAEEAGRWVLAEDAARVSRLAVAAEIEAVEAMLSDGAQRIAVELGADACRAEMILLAAWRDHRAIRSDRPRASAESKIAPAVDV